MISSFPTVDWSPAEQLDAKNDVSKLIELMDNKGLINTVEKIKDFADKFSLDSKKSNWNKLRQLSIIIQQWLVNYSSNQKNYANFLTIFVFSRLRGFLCHTR